MVRDMYEQPTISQVVADTRSELEVLRSIERELKALSMLLERLALAKSLAEGPIGALKGPHGRN